MIAAKKVASSDVSHVVTRHNWTSGRHYSMYAHTETMTNLLAERTGQTISSGTGTQILAPQVSKLQESGCDQIFSETIICNQLG